MGCRVVRSQLPAPGSRMRGLGAEQVGAGAAGRAWGPGRWGPDLASNGVMPTDQSGIATGACGPSPRAERQGWRFREPIGPISSYRPKSGGPRVMLATVRNRDRSNVN